MNLWQCACIRPSAYQRADAKVTLLHETTGDSLTYGRTTLQNILAGFAGIQQTEHMCSHGSQACHHSSVTVAAPLLGSG
jgi:hypothetical protein